MQHAGAAGAGWRAWRGLPARVAEPAGHARGVDAELVDAAPRVVEDARGKQSGEGCRSPGRSLVSRLAQPALSRPSTSTASCMNNNSSHGVGAFVSMRLCACLVASSSRQTLQLSTRAGLPQKSCGSYAPSDLSYILDVQNPVRPLWFSTLLSIQASFFFSAVRSPNRCPKGPSPATSAVV